MKPTLPWWLLTTLCLVGSVRAQSGQIAFQGAVVTPTLTQAQVRRHLFEGGAPSIFVRQDTLHTAAHSQDPPLLVHALRRDPGHPVHLTTLTYF